MENLYVIWNDYFKFPFGLETMSIDAIKYEPTHQQWNLIVIHQPYVGKSTLEFIFGKESLSNLETAYSIGQ